MPLILLCNLLTKHKVEVAIVNVLEEEWITILCNCNLILCRGSVGDKLCFNIARNLVYAVAVGLNYSVAVSHCNICHRVAALVANGTSYWWKVA